MADNVPVSLLAFTLGGALLGFLIFNFNPAKIFMGDSGSLTIGAIISVLAINMIEHEPATMPGVLNDVSRPIMAMAIVVYPLIDTLRIFIYRALKGQSPFSADKNHIHHKLLKIGAGHKRAVIILYLASLATVGSVIVFTWMGFSDTVVLICVFSFAIALAQLPYFFKNKTKIGNAEKPVEE
jgi:UDP-N-acetylmuramyl pentapeptide phosphotransferase/UDP-N-acetylglucosamine-1-phosphate transferase